MSEEVAHLLKNRSNDQDTVREIFFRGIVVHPDLGFVGPVRVIRLQAERKSPILILRQVGIISITINRKIVGRGNKVQLLRLQIVMLYQILMCCPPSAGLQLKQWHDYSIG